MHEEKVVWSKTGIPTEISWEALNKACALLGVACVINRKYAREGLRNEYIRKMVATLWHHKIEKADCEKGNAGRTRRWESYTRRTFLAALQFLTQT